MSEPAGGVKPRDPVGELLQFAASLDIRPGDVLRANTWQDVKALELILSTAGVGTMLEEVGADNVWAMVDGAWLCLSDGYVPDDQEAVVAHYAPLIVRAWQRGAQ